jgi:thiamine pyrophosphokinase
VDHVPLPFLSLLNDHYDALLVANGSPLNRALFRQLSLRTDRMIALDGGLNTLWRWRQLPSDVIGDLDSASAPALQWARSHGARIHRRASADEPDFAKGLSFCQAKHLKNILAVGFSGERTDHTLSALHCAFHHRGLSVTLLTNDVIIFPLHGKINRTLAIPPGHSISWFGFPEAGPCTLTGVCWPFRNRHLAIDSFHSLSNEPAAPEIHLSQQAGKSVFMVTLLPQK